MLNNKPKAIYFFQYLPPWRIDVFNEMSKYYDLTIAFTNADTSGFTYNREELLGKLNSDIKTIFLKNGFKIKTTPFRFGIKKLIKQIQPEIMFSHECSPTSILVTKFRKKFNYKHIITTSDNIQIAEAVSGIKASLRQYILKRANGVIVYSNSVKKWYQNHFPNLSVDICPNIQDPESFEQYKLQFPKLVQTYKDEFKLNNSKIALYTGRLVSVKGLDLLLNAFAKSKNSNWKLVLVGDGNEKENLHKQCQTLEIEGKVVFAGYYSGVDLYAWYALADFFVLPSRFEPFGAVVNEALILGCPVMASQYIGATDFIDSNNGALFNPLNEEEFINTLNQFYMREKRSDKNLMNVSFDNYVKAFYKIVL